MKGLRGLFRLGTLTLLALTLMVAMALPSAAADECSSSQMLDEVEIVRVTAKESPASWSAQDLVDFDYDGDIDNGLLEVVFKDIPTDFEFDGYIIEAVPGDDDPGNSYKFVGKDGYKSGSLIARPSVVGSNVTQVLNLEPGTKYYVTIYAVNHNTVQISPNQRAQDSSSATTLLSAPFLGALNWRPTLAVAGLVTVPDNENDEFAPCATGETPAGNAETCIEHWWKVDLNDDDFKGAHFSLYGAENEAGQHYFRWLNPADYGPFDHTILDNEDSNEADMLSLDKDGDVEDDCEDEGGDCGHTHYQFKAVDDNGNTVASELVETSGSFSTSDADFFQVVFSAESGDLTLSVSLGRMVGGKYKAMSDTASVMFEAPDDLRALDQTYDEYSRVNSDITDGIEEDDDVEAYLDSVFTTASWSNTWTDKQTMTAYLNNQLN
ncbi:MAG: fibronectin type III domain-containing protein [Caldilineaceae bacterium SB0662_bin_9]|uniref:Fibronectin type III domain-containing protein n=1 Tax=Caldilineaceae bacterium SB0662_bin_9 TaxID=2605258 RepID=A0A6B1DUX6_9CHLR|nr:fibronectin type III domain-containing protein [Caldilineaceae bacterium SB0662_bin_9]